MSKVFVNVGMSLDGFIAGLNGGPKNPMGGVSPLLHAWMFKQDVFRKKLGIPGDGETGRDNELATRTFDRIGANIMGKRMFDEGEAAWPEDAPFHCPVYVLTKEKRDPWPRPGGTTFYFVNDGIERAFELAKEAAGSKDVRISGGAALIRQYLEAGYVEELEISLAPVILGEGVRLFEGIGRSKLKLEMEEVIPSSGVTHLRYRVSARAAE
jgi:dihydrofolate reductase